MSVLRALLVSCLLLISVTTTASTIVTTLIDIDRDSTTGCVVAGMHGVEYVAGITVEESLVTSVRSQRCVAGALSIAEVASGGWPAPLNGEGRDIEFSLLYSTLGVSPSTLLRVGFITDDEGVRTTLFDTPAIEPVAYTARRRRASRPAVGRPTPVVDGRFEDWAEIPALASNATLSVWSQTDGDRLFLRFSVRVIDEEAPVAVPDAYHARQGRTLSIAAPGVLANDADPNGLPLSAKRVTAPTSGYLQLSEDGSFTYVHDGSEGSVDAFKYEADNGTATSGATTVTIHLAPNHAPVAADDSFAIGDGSLSVGAPGVLSNDTDEDGDAITAEVVTQPLHGTFTLDADGSFTYSSDGTRNDSFTYRAFDGISVSNPATVTLTSDIPLNAAPVASADVFVAMEDETLQVGAPGVLANDVDADGDPLAVEILATTTSGTLVAQTDGSFSYTPNADFFGTDGFDYRVSDGLAQSGTTRVTINVTAVNDPPVATSDDATVAEGASVAIGVLLNDSDVDGDPITPSIITLPAYGVVVMNTDGSISYTHDGSETLSDSFTYAVTDGSATSGAVLVSITITPVNDAPVATDDSATVEEGSSTTIAVLANDSDAEGTALTPVIVTMPANGVVVVNGDGTVTYTHDGSETLADSFTYRASDGTGSSAPAAVTITVTPVNDAPVATADTATVAEGNSIAIAVLANDADAEGSALTPVVDTLPSNGTLVVNGDGTISYTHNGSETSSDTFTYHVTDGVASSAPATVTVVVTPVNDAPVATADAATVAEGGIIAIDVLANDTDPDDTAFTVTIVDAPVNGTATIEADGSITYTHDGSETLTDTFTYSINDGDVSSNVVAVTLTVTPVNDAPVAANDSATVAEGGTATIAVLANDNDADSSSFTVAIATGPAHGSATVNGDGTISYTHDGSETLTDSFTYLASDGSATSAPATVTITVTPQNDAPAATNDSATVNEAGSVSIAVLANDIDPDDSAFTVSIVASPANGSVAVEADGSITYTHDGSETLSDTFTYSIHDGDAGSNTATVTITVTPVNDAPVAVADAGTVAEGGSTILTVVANDTDAEGSALIPVIAAGPSNGTVVVNGDGTITYTHDGSETLADTFTYRASDGAASSDPAAVSIIVTPVNDAPSAANDSATVAEGGSTSISVLANDTDPDSAAFTVNIIATPLNGTATIEADGSITYVHNGGETTSDTFTYTSNDGSATSNVATVTLTITPVNDAPVASADAATVNEGDAVPINVVANDTDAEGSTLTPAIVAGPVNGTAVVNGDRTITYTHSGTETTADSFTYQVSDGTALSNVVTVSITITPVNDAPVAVTDSATVNEGALVNIAVQANDSDAEGQALTTSIVSGPTNGTATVLLNGTVDYQHDGSETTSDSFTYRVSDGTADSNTVTVSITVNGVNDPPVAADDSGTVNEGAATTIDVLANDVDAENATLTITIESGAANGTLTIGPGGITYTHDGSETTTDSFTYRITDPDAAFDIATVTVAIDSVNDAPVANDDTASVAEGGAIAISVLTNDTDAENDTLTPSIVDSPSHGTVVVNGDGTITYTQNGAEELEDSFSYRVNDGSADSNVATVVVTITAVNDAPVAVADTATVAEGGTVAIAVLGNDSDAENDALTVVLDTTPTNGTATVEADGSVTYAHSGNETTSDSFTYHVTDPSTAASSTVTVTITITPVNDAPVAVDDAYDYPTDGSALAVAAAGVLGNDTDVDSTITAALVTGPAEGTLGLNPDGSFTYTKDPTGTLTTLTFTYQATDGLALSNVATVTLTLNTAPVAVADTFTVFEDQQLSVPAPGVLANDTDAQNNITRVVLVSGPNCVGYGPDSCGSFLGLIPLGEDGLMEDGSFEYQAPAHFAGAVTFTYKLEDGGGLESNTVTATINVTPVNDPPEFTPAAFTINVPNNGQIFVRNLWAELIQPGPVEAADEATQQVRFEATATDSSLFQPITEYIGGEFVVAMSGIHIDESGTLRIKPRTTTGMTNVSIVAIDSGGTTNGGVDTSDPVIITVNVVSANVAPTFNIASQTVAEDSGAANRSGFVTSISAPEAGQTVTMSIVGNTNPTLFSVAPALTGSGTARNVTFTPAANAHGVATLTIRAQDNGSPTMFLEKTATITITAVNDAPSFVKGANLQYGAAVSGVQTISGWATSISQGPNETGQTLTFNVTVRTGASVFAVAPAIDGTTGTLTFNLNGTPGLATIDVRLNDGQASNNLSATQTFLIAAGGVNTPPSFVKGANVTRLEDSGPHTVAGWATSIDDGDAAATQVVSFVVTNNNNALFSAQPAIDGTGTLTFTPAANAFGVATVTVRAQDDGGTANGGINQSDPQTFTITITGINDQPSLSVSPTSIMRGENGGLQTFAGFATPNPGPNETGQTFTYTVTQTSGDPLFTGVGASVPAVAANGTLTFQTAVDAIGTATFSVVAKDNGGLANGGIDTSAAQSFTITITDGNVTIPGGNITIDAYPNIPISITNDASDVTYRLLEGVTVPVGKGPATVLITSKPANSLVTIDDPLTGAFTFRSGTLAYAAGAVQSQSFKFRACDIDGNCSAERTVTVNFGSRPLIFFVDDDSPQSPGLHTFDVPGRMMHTGFTHTSPAPAATYIVMSGSYTNGTTASPVNTRIRSGDQVLGQGLAGLSMTGLGVVDLPVGTLPAFPDLSTGTTPHIHMPDPEYRPAGGGIIVNEGSTFLGYGGGTVKNLRISKAREYMNSWIMISRTSFTSIGGNYVFENITCDNGQSFAMSQTAPGSVTVRNSTLNIAEGFASNNGTWVFENTVINLVPTEGQRKALFYNASTPGVVAQSYTIDAASSVTLGPGGDLFSTTTPVGTFVINAPLTITRTGSVNGLVINGISSVALNGKVDVTTENGKPVVMTNVTSIAMPNVANTFKMTGSIAGFANAMTVSNVGVAPAGVWLSNLDLDGGNLSFSTTSGGTITLASGMVNAKIGMTCVDLSSAPNVVVDPAVTFTNCMQ